LKTIGNKLRVSQVRELRQFGERLKRFGVNLGLWNADGEMELLCEAGHFKSDPEQLGRLAREVQAAGEKSTDTAQLEMPVWRFSDGNLVLATVLGIPGQWNGSSGAADVVLIDAGPARTDEARQQRPLADPAGSQRQEEYLLEMLRLLAERLRADARAEAHIEKVGSELAQTYEELVLLHKLSTNMRLTAEDTSFLQMACDGLTEIVGVEGIAVLLEKALGEEKRLVVTAGSGLIDLNNRMITVLHSRLLEELEAGQEALLDSDVDSPFKYDWPEGIRSIIAVPLSSKGLRPLSEGTWRADKIIGMMVAVNRVGKRDFDSIDVKLFTSVANSCAVFVENGRLFRDLKELFIGSLRALSNSIDAKDQYTRGHSERVALISRWIAERLVGRQKFDEEYIHWVYLAGLLHDIGKIGIDEAVLRKPGKLDEHERELIRKHPSIGAGILREIKQMRDIIPGVLCHHERVDGKGYPNGLTGDEIPLMGKIVGVADSFDAMTSKRTYRDALSVEQALAEIERGIGTQFDEMAARALLDSDVYRLWEILQAGPDACADGRSDSSAYGTEAVGALVR